MQLLIRIPRPLARPGALLLLTAGHAQSRPLAGPLLSLRGSIVLDVRRAKGLRRLRLGWVPASAPLLAGGGLICGGWLVAGRHRPRRAVPALRRAFRGLLRGAAGDGRCTWPGLQVGPPTASLTRTTYLDEDGWRPHSTPHSTRTPSLVMVRPWTAARASRRPRECKGGPGTGAPTGLHRVAPTVAHSRVTLVSGTTHPTSPP